MLGNVVDERAVSLGMAAAFQCSFNSIHAPRTVDSAGRPPKIFGALVLPVMPYFRNLLAGRNDS